MALTLNRIAVLIDEISIASLRSWLKAQGVEHSANTKEQMAQRIFKLLKDGSLSEADFESALSNIEEASSKRIVLFELPKNRKHLETSEDFEKHLTQIGKRLSRKSERAPKLPTNPTLVYVSHASNQIRAKWAETQTRIEVDYASLEILKKKVTRVVVMAADLATGMVQLRYDKPEIRHVHKSKDEYFKYYRDLAGQLLGVDFSRFEIREALRSLVDTEPRVVRIRVNEHRSKTDKSIRFVDRKGRSDVRDDPEWEAAYKAGGSTRAYDDQAVFWLPNASKGILSREVFTDIDAVSSTVRVEADCHEGEIQYAVSTIRAHQIKASQS